MEGMATHSSTPPSNAGSVGLIPGWGIKVPHAVGYGQKLKKKKRTPKDTSWEVATVTCQREKAPCTEGKEGENTHKGEERTVLHKSSDPLPQATPPALFLVSKPVPLLLS